MKGILVADNTISKEVILSFQQGDKLAFKSIYDMSFSLVFGLFASFVGIRKALND